MKLRPTIICPRNRASARAVLHDLIALGALRDDSEDADFAREAVDHDRGLFFESPEGYFGIQPLCRPNERFQTSWIRIPKTILSHPNAYIGLLCPLLPLPIFNYIQYFHDQAVFDGFKVDVPQLQRHLRLVYGQFGFEESRSDLAGHVTMRLPLSRIHVPARKFLPFIGALDVLSTGQKGHCVVDGSAAGVHFSSAYADRLVKTLALEGSDTLGIEPDWNWEHETRNYCLG